MATRQPHDPGGHAQEAVDRAEARPVAQGGLGVHVRGEAEQQLTCRQDDGGDPEPAVDRVEVALGLGELQQGGEGAGRGGGESEAAVATPERGDRLLVRTDVVSFEVNERGWVFGGDMSSHPTQQRAGAGITGMRGVAAHEAEPPPGRSHLHVC